VSELIDELIASSIKWPAYTLDNPQNIVFDANITNLSYLERDIYRAEAIAYLSSSVLLDDVVE